MAIAVAISASVGGIRLPISSATGRWDWMEKPKSPWSGARQPDEVADRDGLVEPELVTALLERPGVRAAAPPGSRDPGAR